ncbi:hypothetical protein DRE_00113 [Drechslerella stenobrocha 248]|uniref:Uncharacterized protein n=1 Tax=Drechslerella stenobrocha 248 TaxID=1043628 RepID=W7I912_9PEZI|nr:hypothetical protein DRE_00113 [Drechslerella stenobrocha 248]
MTPPPNRPLRPSPGAAGRVIAGYFEGSPVRTTPPLLRRRTSSRSGSTPHTPDRFIPSAASVQSFRIQTPSGRRSEEERRARRRSASPILHSRSSRSRSVSASRIGAANSFSNYGVRPVARISNITGAPEPAIGNQPERGFVVNAAMNQDDTVLKEETEMHEERLALALGVNLDAKVMSFESTPSPEKNSPGVSGISPNRAGYSVWNPDSPQMEAAAANLKRRRNEVRKVVSTPFR